MVNENKLPNKPVVNTDDKQKPVDNKPANNKTEQKKVNAIHPIKDVLGKDDNVNFVKNVITVDSFDKWSYDAYPLQLVLDFGVPPKEIDYFRISSGNEQPFKVEFANDNIATGYSKGTSGELKHGINDIEVGKDVVARFARFEFTGNKKLDEDKNQKPDPLAIYFIQAGQGEIKKDAILPAPPDNRPVPPTPENTEPPKPTEGRLKDNGPDNEAGWGADYNKGAGKWKIVRMRDDAKLFKVVDSEGTNVADLFHTPESAQTFITWYQWKQGEKPEPTPEPGPEPTPGPKPEPTPVSGTDKYGVKLLKSDGKTITYDYEKDDRPGKDDGIRYNMENVGKWKQSEVTGYFMFTKDPVDDEISIKWSEMGHSGKNNVQCYDSGLEIKTGKARLRFENPHPEYSGNLGAGQGEPLPAGKWIGYKGTKTVESDGSVTITLYQDAGNNEGDKPANEWKETFKYNDKKYKRNGPHPELTLRVDDPKKQGQKNLREKWLSAALIE